MYVHRAFQKENLLDVAKHLSLGQILINQVNHLIFTAKATGMF